MLSPACVLQSEVLEFEETLVVASRLPAEQATASLAGNSLVLEGEVLQDSSVSFLPELLSNRAGIGFASFFGNDDLAAPQWRGFGENSQLRTLVTIDGLPVSQSDLSVSPWSRTSLANLEKVSILRGGRTVRYGPSAVAGVIALETKTDRELGWESETTFGSDETFRQRLSLSTPLSGWQFGAQLEHFSTDGYRENSDQESTSASFSFLTPEAVWGKNRVLLSASRNHFQDPGPLSLSAFREDSRQSLQPDQSLQSESLTLANQLTLFLGSDWELAAKGRVGQRQRESDYQGRLTQGDFLDWDGELVLSREGEDWNLELGYRYTRSELDFERSNRGSARGRQFADLSRESQGAFGIVRWEPNERWAFSAGGSWDRYRLDGQAREPNDPNNDLRNFSGNTEESEWAYEIGVEWKLTDDSLLWLRYDRSVRFPVLDEVAFFQGFDSPTPFNAELRPETGQGLELGWRQETNEHWTWGATLFGQWLQDEIFFDGFSNLNENLPATERLGAELSVSHKGDCWDAGLFYNATFARFRDGFDDGERVPLVPRHSLSGSLTWHATSSLDLGVEGRFVSQRSDGNDRGELAQLIQFREIPSYSVWNATARWELNEHCSFFLRCNNLFDEDFISTQFSNGIFPGAGRQFLVGAKLTY